MTHLYRTTAILMLVFLATAGAFAQPAQPAATETVAAQATETSAAAEPSVSEERADASEQREVDPQVRENFSRLVNRHPEELGRILALDPTLLLNEPFLARYPELAQFVAENPEIRRNPHYFVQQFDYEPPQRRGVVGEIIEALSIAFVFGLIAFALAWLVRTIIEQKRWNRLSRTQSEVHNKILDRFGSSEELLAYIKTPAGTKFLESAPIPLHSEPVMQQNVPMGRALWSIQIGVIVAAAGLGLFLVSLRFEEETAQDLFSLGVVAFFIGAGFIASAAVSIFMTRRLGLLPPAAGASDTFSDSGAVR